MPPAVRFIVIGVSMAGYFGLRQAKKGFANLRNDFESENIVPFPVQEPLQPSRSQQPHRLKALLGLDHVVNVDPVPGPFQQTVV